VRSPERGRRRAYAEAPELILAVLGRDLVHARSVCLTPARLEVDAHGTSPLVWATVWAPALWPSCQRALPEKAPPTAGVDPKNAKSPAERGFSRCAEEDSNLHPVIPDQALESVGA
jgi:hypothetical protein